MRQFIEFVPVAVFAVVYFMTRNIYIATAVLMAGVCVQVGIEYGMDRQVRKQTRMVFYIVVIFGGMTLAFQDELFIKWKPTIVNWVFCVSLLLSQYLSNDNLLQKLLGEHLRLPQHVWRKLAFGWSFGFFLAGALNLAVAYGFSTDFWVTYKLVGGIAITLSYLVITMIWLVKGGYIRQEDADDTAETPTD